MHVKLTFAGVNICQCFFRIANQTVSERQLLFVTSPECRKCLTSLDVVSRLDRHDTLSERHSSVQNLI
jgi:hypothetical protein